MIANSNYFQQESERLSFRKLCRDDIPIWTTFFEDNPLLKFVGVDLNKTPLALATDWIETQLKRYEISGLGHLAAETKGTNEFVGVGGIIPRTLDGRKEFEIAYSLIPKYWSKGYATELAKQMSLFGKANLEADRFVSIIDKQNIGSIKVAKKNGMEVLFETHYLEMDVFVYGKNNNKMKKMTCRQLGGACDLEFEAASWEEMAELSKNHGRDMMMAGDDAHLEAMSKMEAIMKQPGGLQKWMADRKAEFDAL